MIHFSIITVTFNAADVVEDTLDSVYRQNYPYIEHIIVDGASTDLTLPRCEQYRERCELKDSDHKVIIVSEPDKGLYDAMNKGLKLATGDYVVFINAGDKLPQVDTLDCIANCVGEAEPLPAVLYGDTDIIDKNGKVLRHRRFAAPKHLSWRSFRHGMLVCHQAFYARTDIARETPYNLNYRYSSDVDWCIRIMKKGRKLHLPLRNVQNIIAHFLEGGTSIENHRESLKERFRVMSKHYGVLSTVAMHAWFTIRAVLKR